MTSGTAWPEPGDFAAPPTAADRARWDEADRAARPIRLGRLRAHMAANGVDGYFGLRREHMRYLTGFILGETEANVAGDSGRFLVTGDEVVLLADSRYRVQAAEQAPECRVFDCYHALPDRWAALVTEAGVRRVAVEATAIPQATWERLTAAAPDVELVPVDGWVERDRQTKEPSELERVAAACAIADRALAALLPSIRPGVTEHDLALDLEWRMRTGGGECLAFEVACLSGPRAALPHGAPGARPVATGEVLLFDFGAQVGGYRSDMTRTLFVGRPADRDLAVHQLVAAAQAAAIERLREGIAAAAHGVPLPNGRVVDAVAREVILDDGRWPGFEHGLGHGIGIATHELPSLGKRAPETPLPSPTVTSVEPGIYLDGETGVRIEDLLVIDAAEGRLERITHFPPGVVIVGA